MIRAAISSSGRMIPFTGSGMRGTGPGRKGPRLKEGILRPYGHTYAAYAGAALPELPFPGDAEGPGPV